MPANDLAARHQVDRRSPISVKRGPSLRMGLVVLSIGAVLAIPAGVIVAVRAVRTIDSPAVTTPGVTGRQLAAGTWVVYQRTGTSSGEGGFSFTQNHAPDLDPSQVTVTGLDGIQLPVEAVSVNETITRGSKIYTAAVQFKVSTPGRYRIAFNTPTAVQVLVIRSLGDTFRSVAAPLVVGGFGGLLVVTGLALVIVGAIRRSNEGQPMAVASWSQTPVPPGWYPDSQAPGAQRWWDGSRWTEHHL